MFLYLLLNRHLVLYMIIINLEVLLNTLDFKCEYFLNAYKMEAQEIRNETKFPW